MSKQNKKSDKKDSNVKKKIVVKAPIDFKLWVAALIFIVTTSLFFWGQLNNESFFWEDFAEFVYPVQSFASSEAADGNIPFWNPYTFVGMPFMADIQVGFF